MAEQYVSARDALIRELERAEASLKGAAESYAADERSLHEAQRRAARSYEGRAANARNVDRLRLALALIEDDERNPIVAELKKQGVSSDA